MKEIYVKPRMEMETLTLSEYIAGNCDITSVILEGEPMLISDIISSGLSPQEIADILGLYGIVYDISTGDMAYYNPGGQTSDPAPLLNS